MLLLHVRVDGLGRIAHVLRVMIMLTMLRVMWNGRVHRDRGAIGVRATCARRCHANLQGEGGGEREGKKKKLKNREKKKIEKKKKSKK